MRDAEFLGRLSAIVEINERVALSFSAGEGRISELTARMQQAAGEIDDLKEVAEFIRKHGRTA